jgi:hypothetical protein
MTIKRTTNCSEEGALHVEVTEDPIEQPDAQTDRQTDRRTKRNLLLFVRACSRRDRMLMITIKRTTNCSEKRDRHVEITEDPIEQPHRQTDRRTDRQTNVIFTYNGTSFQGFATHHSAYAFGAGCSDSREDGRDMGAGYSDSGKGGGGSGIGGTKPFASYYGLAPHSYVSPTYIDGYICTGTMKMYVYTFAIHRN